MREKSSQSLWSEEQQRIEILRKDGVDDTLRFSPLDKLNLEYLSSTLPCVEGCRHVEDIHMSYHTLWLTCVILFLRFHHVLPSSIYLGEAYSVLRSMNPSQTSVGGPSPTVSLKSKP